MEDAFEEITRKLLDFRDERAWDQFHDPKDLALAVSVEAAELLELFLWKKSDQVSRVRISEELADVFAYAFLLAEKYKLDIRQCILDKMAANAGKYPVDRSKGNARKYNER